MILKLQSWGTKVSIRVCDLYANCLSGIEGLPECQLYWPESSRNAAVSLCIDRLTRYGTRYQNNPAATPSWRFAYDLEDGAILLLPRLDHPATDDDVKAGRAIFSLAGQGYCAPCWTVLHFPPATQWPALKEHRFLTCRRQPDGSLRDEVIYIRDGTIWQAEEVFKDGKWQRYYGFVGANEIAQVPAEQIEFPMDPQSNDQTLGDMSHGSRAAFRRRQIKPGSLSPASGRTQVVLEIGNSAGSQQRFRPHGFKISAARQPAPGLELRVGYSPPSPTHKWPSSYGDDGDVWKELPLNESPCGVDGGQSSANAGSR